MTRKQVLSRAVELFEKYGDSGEISESVEILQGIIAALPLVTWDEPTLKDTLEQYHIDNGRFPLLEEFKVENKLPSLRFLRDKCGLSYGQLLEKFFPERIASEHQEKIDNFITQYKNMQPSNRSVYDNHREEGSPSWSTIANMCGQNTWTGLIEFLNLPSYSSHKKFKGEIKVNIHLDL